MSAQVERLTSNEVDALLDRQAFILKLAERAENLERIDGGFRVKLSDDGRHYIDVMLMLFNWRVVTTPVATPFLWDRGWCYFGTELASFRNAVMAALVWDGSDDTEPAGYDKKIGG